MGRAMRFAKVGWWWWGIGIALCFAAWGMRSVGAYNVVETDAARHAMNGIFLRDLILRGDFTHVMAYARDYYAHLPALSLPYHPPLFPLIEVVFYSLFGVSIFSARLAVAATIAVSAMALFVLARKTHRSTTVAALSTITFLAMPEAMWLGSDVMLEFPTLVFTLLAILCLYPIESGYPRSRALAFGILAGAAVWTKQTAVFLVALPLAYILFLRRWRLLAQSGVWVSTIVSAGIVAALAGLSLPINGAGVMQAIPGAPIPLYLAYYRLIVRNGTYYVTHYYEATGPAGLILLAALAIGLLVELVRRGRVTGAEEGDTPSLWDESALYLAWMVTSLAVLFVLRPIATRYMFFAYPALIVSGYGALMRLASMLPGGRKVALAAAAGLTLLTFFQFPLRTHYLHGPEVTARILAEAHPSRILYCGGTDGNFILNYHIASPGLETTIITGDKLPVGIFTPARFEEFAHDYGVQYVVLEDASGWHGPWRQLIHDDLPSMVLERKLDLLSSTERWKGSLRIYRFTNPSPHPKSDLAMRMLMIGGMMDFQLGN
jgi:Dolichyl-phosphate-mannose-protein mannosyltransferase